MEPEPIQPGMLIDICKYLDSLQYRVWRKMVMSVESGEWGCGQVIQVIGGTSCMTEPAELTFSSLPFHRTLSSLDRSLLRPRSERSPVSWPCPSSTPCPAAQTPPSSTPSSLSHDTQPPLQRKKLTVLSIQHGVMYTVKALPGSGLPPSRWFQPTGSLCHVQWAERLSPFNHHQILVLKS